VLLVLSDSVHGRNVSGLGKTNKALENCGGIGRRGVSAMAACVPSRRLGYAMTGPYRDLFLNGPRALMRLARFSRRNQCDVAQALENDSLLNEADPLRCRESVHFRGRRQIVTLRSINRALYPLAAL
jgi:hypothetical protein